ncbi:MAG: hypothetical protein U9N85_07480 [Bacteroidota bacterium]|nr:hypothetical protein [Bacteroidota bacterium]
MRKKHIYLRTLKISILSLMFSSLFLGSCESDPDNSGGVLITDSVLEEQATDNIMYSVPAPSDMAGLLIDNPNLTFNADYLNSTDNHTKYSTNKRLAINLGIYIADLSYAGYYEKNQISREYFDLTERISQELGIDNAIGEEQAKIILEGKPDKDRLIRIINETFMNTDAYLLENKRHDIMAMILVGGWIEAQYIAISYTDGLPEKYPDLTRSILDQAISVEIMTRMLDQAEKDVNLKDLKADFEKISLLYKKMGENPSNKDFKDFCTAIKDIRTRYTA